MQFEELHLNEDLLAGIRDAKFESCMPVQEKTFADTLHGQDVYVQSQTGSGKTAAFLITIFEHFQRGTFEQNRAVIIVPTRELAVQIEEEAKLLGAHLPYRIGSFFGGVGYDEQLRLLDKKVEIIVGTPGRLIDLNERRKLDFRDTSILVIDEADRLFDMGFIPDLRRMLKRMPDREKRLTMLFSATLNSRVWQLAWEHMHDPVQIILNPENLTVDEVHQELYHVARTEKIRLLLGLLQREKPENALIFTNTKSGAVEVSGRLEKNGYESQYIIGDLPQKKRLKLIDRMKAGELQILVATDVAARGLHIDDLPLVVNYDLPEDPEGYVHRIGRTARAGSTGKAISLACERFVYSLEAIEELIDRKIPVEWHDETMLVEDKSAGQRISDDGHGRGRSDRSRGSSSGRSRGSSRRGSHSSRSRSPRPAERSRSQVPDSKSTQKSQARPVSTTASNTSSPEGERAAQPKAPTSSNARAHSTNGGDRQRRKPAPKRGGDKGAVSSNDSMADRLEYYRKKYGEDFQLVEDEAPSKSASEPDESSKKPLIKRIFGKKKRS